MSPLPASVPQAQQPATQAALAATRVEAHAASFPARPGYPYLGRQVLADYHGCPADLLADPVRIEVAMRDAALACSATIVECVFHRFNPHGVSGVVVIAESHLAIHTWPEYGYAAVDVFTCGDSVDPAEAVMFLNVALQATTMAMTEVSRGNLRLLKQMGD